VQIEQLQQKKKESRQDKPKANTVKVETSTQVIQLEGMRPNETLKQFNNRLYNQTKQVLLDESKKASRQNEKMKKCVFAGPFQRTRHGLILTNAAFYCCRRLKERDEKKQEKKRKREEEEAVPDFSQLRDSVKFGEQADRPPIFTAQPKMKKAKLVESNPEDRAMDLLRERVRAQVTSKQPMTAARSNKLANAKLSSIIDAWRGKS
jgi:hypothetical protein